MLTSEMAIHSRSSVRVVLVTVVTPEDFWYNVSTRVGQSSLKSLEFFFPFFKALESP